MPRGFGGRLIAETTGGGRRQQAKVTATVPYPSGRRRQGPRTPAACAPGGSSGATASAAGCLRAYRAGSVRAWLDARQDGPSVRAARGRLAGVGFSRERIERFPADQILLLDAKREYEVVRDEAMKLASLPCWQAEELAAKARPARERALEQTLFGFLEPATETLRRTQGRLDQRIPLLRHVEALRLYAADHGARPLLQLADLPVPLPSDPFTGKPFPYQVNQTTAHLRGTPPRAEEKKALFNVRYEVTIRR